MTVIDCPKIAGAKAPIAPVLNQGRALLRSPWLNTPLLGEPTCSICAVSKFLTIFLFQNIERWFECSWGDWFNQGLWQNQTKLTKGSIKTRNFLRKTVLTNFRFAYINWPSWKFISTLEFLYGSLEWWKIQKFGGAIIYSSIPNRTAGPYKRAGGRIS